MQTIDRNQSHSCSPGVLLAGAAFLAALAFAAPGQAFAACGGSATTSTGTHPASAGRRGTHSGSTPSAGSTGGGSSCGVSATKSALSVGLTPSLAGVHTGAITGNGGKRKGSTTSGNTASTVTNSRNVSTNTKTLQAARYTPRAAAWGAATSSTPASIPEAAGRCRALKQNGRRVAPTALRRLCQRASRGGRRCERGAGARLDAPALEQERRLGLGRLRPAITLASAGFSRKLAKAECFRDRRPLRRVVGRGHWIVSRQVPFLAILRRRQAEPRQVTPHSLELFAVLETDQKVRGDRPADRHCGRSGRRTLWHFIEPLNR